MYRFLIYQFPVILWAVIILTVSSMPNFGIISVKWTKYDKVIHFVEYGVFGYLLTRALFYQDTSLFIKNYALIMSIIIGVMFAGFDEIHQKFIPGRIESLGDFIADVSGIVLAQVFFIKNLFLKKDTAPEK